MFAETSCESESSRDATQGRAHNNTSEFLSRVQPVGTEICECQGSEELSLANSLQVISERADISM
jgi:hypothetical protein